LPQDHRFYLYMSMIKLNDFSEIKEYLIAEFNKKESYTSFIENTGIKPLEDINHIALSNWKKNENDDEYAFIVDIKKDFNKERLFYHFKKNENDEDGLFVSIHKDSPLYLFFIDESIIILSNSLSSLKSMIHKITIQNQEKNNGILSRYVFQDTIFGFGFVIESIDKNGNVFNIPFNIFKSIKVVSLFLERENSGFLFTVHLVTDAKMYIEFVKNLIKGVAGILSLQVQFGEIREFLENLVVQEEMDGLKLFLRLTKKDVDKLFVFLKEKKVFHKSRPVSDNKSRQDCTE